MIEKTASDARQNFAELINHVAFGGERVLIHRHGKQLAAIVPISDMNLLQDLETRIDLDDARTGLREAQEKGTVSLQEIKQQLGL